MGGSMKAFLNTNTARRFCALMLLCSAAYAFAWNGLIMAGNQLTVALSGARAEEVGCGNWLFPIALHLTGGLSVPFLSGLLAGFCLSGFVLLLCHRLHIHRMRDTLVIGALLLLWPGTLRIMLSARMPFFVCLAMFLSSLGCCLAESERKARRLAPLIFAIAAGLDSGCLFLPFMLLLLSQGIKSPLPRTVQRPGFLAALTAIPLWFAGWILSLHHFGLGVPSISHLSRALLSPVRVFSYAAYPHAAPAAALIVLLAGIWLISGYGRHAQFRLAALFVFLFLLSLPARLVSIAAYGGDGHPLGALICLPFVISVLDNAPKKKLLVFIRRTAALCLSIVFLGQIIFIHQISLRRRLEYDATLSVMSRVVDRLEEQEGFIPGLSPVALFGALDTSVLSVAHEGFESLDAFDSHHYGVYEEGQNTAYFWQIMGYPLNFISDFERDQLAATEAVQNAPAFPREGCAFLSGKVFCVKLSER